MIDFFSKSRFGMFIHFGLYSIPGGIWKGKEQGRNRYAEWIKYQAFWPEGGIISDQEYDELAKEFSPVNFDADKWAWEAGNAGMKYIVITTKHHDGFALWDSKVDNYNVVRQTPFGRDIIRELKEACERHKLILGAYYSHWLDWNYPGGGLPQWPEIPADPPIKQPADSEFEQYFSRKCLPQVTELLDDYGIRLFWFDNWCKAPFLTEERIERLIDLVHSRGGIVNSRIGVTWNHAKGNDAGIDYISMGDNEFPKHKLNRPWETSGTFNDSWGYHKLDYGWKPTGYLLKCLINNASRNGNYQLNVGPLPDGSFPAPSIRRLREIGAWMTVHGKAVCNTVAASLPEPEWGRLTVGEDGTVYAHVFINEPACTLRIDGLKKKPVAITIMESGQPVNYDFKDEILLIKMPRESISADLNVLKIEFNYLEQK